MVVSVGWSQIFTIKKWLFHHFHPLKNGCLGVPGTHNLQPSLHVHMIFSLNSFFHLYLWKFGWTLSRNNQIQNSISWGFGRCGRFRAPQKRLKKQFFFWKGDFWVKKGMSSPFFQPKKMQHNAVKTKEFELLPHVHGMFWLKRKRPDIWLTVQNCPGSFPGSFSSDVKNQFVKVHMGVSKNNGKPPKSSICS